jgi:hypothetical protein
MGFYKPATTDEYGAAQFEVLGALQAQLQLTLDRRLQAEGFPGQSLTAPPPAGASEELTGFLAGLRRVNHSLGGVHLGVLAGIRTRTGGQ